MGFAGYSAAVGLNAFTITFFAFANGILPFSANNIGDGKMERVKKGYGAGVVLALIAEVTFFTAFLFFAENMIYIFTSYNSTVVLKTGIEFLQSV